MYGRETHVQTVFIMNSPFIISWVEIRATKGIVTKSDQIKIDSIRKFYPYKRSRAIYKRFETKEKAIQWLKTFDNSLEKRYECRIFSDAQMSKGEVVEGGNGELKIPFTEKQKNEIFYI